MPITVDVDTSPMHFVAAEPCTSWSSAHSQPALFSAQDISDAYHHVHIDNTDVDYAGIYYPANTNPPPPYDIALWDPGYSSDDSLPDLVDNSYSDCMDYT